MKSTPEPDSNPVSDLDFREAMASLPAGVAVVTTWAEPDDPRGATVSAVCSLSAEPPLLLACLGEGSDTGRAIVLGSPFMVNILSEGQEEVAKRFAVKDPTKFEAVPWEQGLLGLPQIAGVHAAVACEAVECLPGGDHTIVVGQIQSTTISSNGGPLLHWRRQFGSFGPPAVA
ncbi:MAG: hypothetical protein QOE60_1504 [Thermoleophilaceae bacterium]|jgi:flavin reductase (DIM6/NTAB) family NADH-FMN oxidoreductase RutF|nr:hypothetical protein [Thermoleophilaceae bacterium]